MKNNYTKAICKVNGKVVIVYKTDNNRYFIDKDYGLMEINFENIEEVL